MMVISTSSASAVSVEQSEKKYLLFGNTRIGLSPARNLNQTEIVDRGYARVKIFLPDNKDLVTTTRRDRKQDSFSSVHFFVSSSVQHLQEEILIQRVLHLVANSTPTTSKTEYDTS